MPISIYQDLMVFFLYPSVFWELRNKRNIKNLQFLSKSLGAMLEYYYIERGLFLAHLSTPTPEHLTGIS